MIDSGPGFLVDFTVVTLAALSGGMLLEMLRPAREYVLSISRWLHNGALALLTYACTHLFGTYQATTAGQQKTAEIGLETHTPNEQRLDGMLWAPFRARSSD